jgi:hypothetical protein
MSDSRTSNDPPLTAYFGKSYAKQLPAQTGGKYVESEKVIVGSASDMKSVPKKSADLSAPAEMMA